ncbi:hypothetical protein E2C01_019969 [Portunus trituberculatus]|uniref:Uncharacterized protein n=1 Tax=Portunus trituberculatus TaxID=210409 RepID=A0A5B7DYZ8_PORTR|nr:hypothetical protein [Portunus trituberculatus]
MVKLEDKPHTTPCLLRPASQSYTSAAFVQCLFSASFIEVGILLAMLSLNHIRKQGKRVVIVVFLAGGATAGGGVTLTALT